MTSPAVTTFHARGSRFYVHPSTDKQAPGVTSILNMLPKGFLKFWAAKLVAEAAVNTRASWLPLAETDPQGAIEYLKKSPDRFTKGAADVGTDAHTIFEKLARNEPLGPITDTLQPFADHFADFQRLFKPRFLFIEETVWSDTHDYAGSFDWLAEIGGELVFGDNKTTRSGVHDEVALQLAAYSHADYILRDDGEQVPIPTVGAGAVFHVRPEGWDLYPARIDDSVFEHFVTLRRIFDWDRAARRGVIGKPVAKPEVEA